jgi:hypothetical protein
VLCYTLCGFFGTIAFVSAINEHDGKFGDYRYRPSSAYESSVHMGNKEDNCPPKHKQIVFLFYNLRILTPFTSTETSCSLNGQGLKVILSWHLQLVSSMSISKHTVLHRHHNTYRARANN